MKRSIPVLLLFAAVLSGSAFATEKTEPPKTVAEPVPPPDGGPAATVIQPPPADPALAPIAPAPTVKTEPIKPAVAPTVPPMPPVGAQPGDEVDLIGDKPEAVAANAPKALMEDMTPDGPLEELNARAKETYKVLADIKTTFELISKDLDNNGKEVTRLIKTSDTLAKKITTLADLYYEDEKFRDHCATAKSDVLRLNDELSQVPRKWAHVRWAFNDTLSDTRMIRIMGRDLAEAELKRVLQVGKDGKPILGKDGKEVYVDQDPKGNPAIAKREASKANAEAMRAILRQQEAARKAAPMKTGNDD